MRAVHSSLCFSSLPAELRNNAYAQTLRWNCPLVLTYNATTQRFRASKSPSLGTRTPLQALELLSGLDQYIRLEARSYFFANNSFEINTKQSWTIDPDYVQIYINFLENIGETGRRSLRNLRLNVSGDSKLHRPSCERAIKLWNLLAGCMNLERLDISLEIDYFYMNQRKALSSYLTTQGFPISDPWPVVLQSLSHLRNLKSMFLHVVYSSRWRHVEFDVYPHFIEGHEENIDRIKFRISRPIDEASALTDQIRGILRAGLRQRVTIRAATTETWNQYNTNLCFLRKPKDGDYIKLLSSWRSKP